MFQIMRHKRIERVPSQKCFGPPPGKSLSRLEKIENLRKTTFSVTHWILAGFLEPSSLPKKICLGTPTGIEHRILDNV